MAIQNLSARTPTASDLVPFFAQSNSADSRCTVSQLATLLQTLLTPGDLETQYSAPNATGFTATIAPTTTGNDVFLILTPAAGYAAGTIVLPALASSVEKQEVQVTCTQSVGTLTVSASGSTVNGAPTSLSANGFFRLRFDAVLSSWYRVG